MTTAGAVEPRFVRGPFRIVKRIFLALGATLIVLTALIGVAHTRWGHPLLALFPFMKGKCPVGLDATPAELDAGRARALQAVRGEGLAPMRPAAGFELERTHRTDIAHWASAHDVACHDVMRSLECDRVAADALDGVGFAPERVPFTFDAHDVLVGLMADSQRIRKDDALAIERAMSATLDTELGPASTHYEARTLDAPLSQAGSEHRFSNYRVLVTATNVGNAVDLKAEYQAIPRVAPGTGS